MHVNGQAATQALHAPYLHDTPLHHMLNERRLCPSLGTVGCSETATPRLLLGTPPRWQAPSWARWVVVSGSAARVHKSEKASVSIETRLEGSEHLCFNMLQSVIVPDQKEGAGWKARQQLLSQYALPQRLTWCTIASQTLRQGCLSRPRGHLDHLLTA